MYYQFRAIVQSAENNALGQQYGSSSDHVFEWAQQKLQQVLIASLKLCSAQRFLQLILKLLRDWSTIPFSGHVTLKGGSLKPNFLVLCCPSPNPSPSPSPSLPPRSPSLV